tara:strand:- start:206 stop:430 length:225 start_codon:yes stop_codon:yes gene_type:complete
MTYLAHLKRNNHCDSCRWIVKFNSKELIREIKLVYKPSEYSKANAKRYGHKARKLHNREQLISVLEDDKKKRND